MIVLKPSVSASQVLAHYDVSLPLKLSCDASAYGMGAVIAYALPDNTEQHIAYAFRTLSSSEHVLCCHV